jgi:hypothetical protein
VHDGGRCEPSAPTGSHGCSRRRHHYEEATANSRHSPGTPLSSCPPRSSNSKAGGAACTGRAARRPDLRWLAADAAQSEERRSAPDRDGDNAVGLGEAPRHRLLAGSESGMRVLSPIHPVGRDECPTKRRRGGTSVDVVRTLSRLITQAAVTSATAGSAVVSGVRAAGAEMGLSRTASTEGSR